MLYTLIHKNVFINFIRSPNILNIKYFDFSKKLEYLTITISLETIF